MLDLAARRVTHCANCVRSVQTDAPSMRTKRAKARGCELCASRHRIGALAAARPRPLACFGGAGPNTGRGRRVFATGSANGSQAVGGPPAAAPMQRRGGEPGQEQSSGLFLPGERPCHRHGAACKARARGPRAQRASSTDSLRMSERSERQFAQRVPQRGHETEHRRAPRRQAGRCIRSRRRWPTRGPAQTLECARNEQPLRAERRHSFLCDRVDPASAERPHAEQPGVRPEGEQRPGEHADDHRDQRAGHRAVRVDRCCRTVALAR